MGIASLVSTGKHEVLDRLPISIANLCLDVLLEIKEREIQGEDYRCAFSSFLYVRRS